MSTLIKDLKGRIFKHLTVIELAEKGSNKRIRWKCVCKCGKVFIAQSDKLVSGRAISCGCRGAIKSPSKNSWIAMVKRCTNPKDQAYHRYGGAGITVCDKWMTLEGFLEDMGEKPTTKHSIDRFPNKDGNYEKANCRWATPKQQSENRKSNVWINFNGKKYIAPQLAGLSGVNVALIRQRLKKGYSIEAALMTPKKYKLNTSNRMGCYRST